MAVLNNSTNGAPLNNVGGIGGGSGGLVGGMIETVISQTTVATGFSITLLSTSHLTVLRSSGNTLLASGTITMPASPAANQRHLVTCVGGVAALTVLPNAGQTVLNPPTSLRAGGSFEMLYSATVWVPYYGNTQTNVSVYAGNPNGNVAGIQGDFVVDTTDTQLWYCSTSGIAALAVWTLLAGSGITTINGNTGSVTGSTVSISGGASAGTTVLFTGSGTALTLGLTDSSNNTFLGGAGIVAGFTGSNNTVIGSGAANVLTTASGNVGLGALFASSLTTGSNNTGLGFQSLASLITGSRNVAIGENAGGSYSGAESDNVLINNPGTTGDSNTLRISASGTSSQQVSKAFIGGINGVTLSGTPSLVTSISGDQLGTATIGSGLTLSGGTLTASGSTSNAQIQATAATTAALTGTYNNGTAGVGATFTVTATGVQTYDGHTVALNDVILIKNQASPFQNGVYLTTTAGAVGVSAVYTRATNYNTSALLYSNIVIKVLTGTLNGGANYSLLATSGMAGVITIGTTNLQYGIIPSMAASTSPVSGLVQNDYSAGSGITNSVGGSTGVYIYNGGATVSTSLPTGVMWTWTSQAVSATGAVGTRYVITAASKTITLPATAAFGSEIEVISSGFTFTVAPGSGQNIVSGTTSGTVGLVTTTVGMTTRFICTVANTTWQVITSNIAGFTLT